MRRDSLTSYGAVTKALHWSMALLILSLIAMGMGMTSLPNSPLKGTVYTFHKSLGVIVLGLLVFRIYWRLTNPTPPLPADLPLWQQGAARLNHLFLYIYMTAMALSGTLMSLLGSKGINWFGLFQLSLPYENLEWGQQLHSVHVTLTNYAWPFLSLHIAIAFYHHWGRKDNILMRMWKS